MNKPEIIDMEADYSPESVICQVIRDLDEQWKSEQQRIVGRANIYTS